MRILAAILLLWIGACVPPPRIIPYLEGGHPGKDLGLVRVTWDHGTRPDSFCVPDIGDDIGYRLRLGLERRGYRVTELPVPPLANSFAPDPVAHWPPNRLFDSASGLERLMRMRIVEYLDASLCDSDQNGSSGTSLDITAEVEIYSRGRAEPVWHTRQRCSVLTGATSEAVRLCVNDLADAIWQRLPQPLP